MAKPKTANSKSSRQSSAREAGDQQFEDLVVAFGVAQAARETRFSGRSLEDESFGQEVRALRDAARAAQKALRR